jgi:hypothetical protein
MIAYFAHDTSKDLDLIILPDADTRTTVDPDKMRTFIAPQPDFSAWAGEACGGLAPDQFGTIVATRDDQGDVCVVDPVLWRERMARYL